MNGRKLSILITDSAAAACVRRALPALRIQAELTQAEPDAVPSIMAERPVDALILGQESFDLAVDTAGHSYTGVLLLASGEKYDDLAPACAGSGVLIARPQELAASLPNLLALCQRLSYLRGRANMLRRQLDDSRLVSRAKLLLIDRLKMSEAEAHRYIEKTAMDSGEKRRDVAERIIRTYEE